VHRSHDISAKVELLRHVGLFSECSRRELTSVASMCRDQRVGSGNVIVEQGSIGDRFFVLAEGLASVHVDGHRVGSISAGSFFGEMALIEHEVRSATVTAELPCRLFVIEERDFPAARAIPSVSDKVLRAMSSRLRRANHGAEVA
jgi:CRP-like cAMP-binding protein